MRIGLFVPCYIDQFYPDVAMATLEILNRFDLTVEYPADQTCCGQPMANTGCTQDAKPVAELFVKLFAEYDYVVCPSGSCVSMVRNHYEEYFHDSPEYTRLRGRTFELCEFLTDVLQVTQMPGSFPYRVGLHQSCHGLRELRLDNASETMVGRKSKVRHLLESLDGIELVSLKRGDECCGFGGTFAVAEEAVSVMMGEDRVADHLSAGAQVMTATDMSCLMHMAGLVSRKKENIRIMHVAQILAGRKPPGMLPIAKAAAV